MSASGNTAFIQRYNLFTFLHHIGIKMTASWILLHHAIGETGMTS